MSNARNLASLLGTDLTIPTAKIADSAITDTKLNGTLNLSSKTLTMPSGVSLFKRAYHASMPSGMNWTTGFATMMSISNVVVNSGEKVYLSYCISARATGTAQKHTGYRLTYSGDSSGTVADNGWGFGINDTTGTSWQLDTNMLCLSDFPHTPFTGTGTMTFNLQGKASTNNGYWAAEHNGTHQTYTNAVFSVYVGEM